MKKGRIIVNRQHEKISDREKIIKTLIEIVQSQNVKNMNKPTQMYNISKKCERHKITMNHRIWEDISIKKVK